MRWPGLLGVRLVTDIDEVAVAQRLVQLEPELNHGVVSFAGSAAPGDDGLNAYLDAVLEVGDLWWLESVRRV